MDKLYDRTQSADLEWIGNKNAFSQSYVLRYLESSMPEVLGIRELRTKNDE